MPSSTVDPPDEAVAVAERYRRLERPLSTGFALLVAAGGAAVAFAFLPGLQAALAVVVLAAAVQFPTFTSDGTARLRTDARPETVREAFAGPTPPVLAFQWGIADTVRRTDDGAVYELSYLLGLRSVEMRVAATTDGDAASDALELRVTADGEPWATYRVSVAEAGDDGGTVVDVTVDSDRRFGPNRVPQWLVAERYREAALAAQGYTVERRDHSLSLRRSG
ncbi:hypothetical protein N0B31_14275 [Salinirubellus salinus]|uniref:Uncharacterized protein n=1 Tax=Salinirubellus salinus TaxID=1364945 RepID=A0A9E7R103_9EURY|nr:hypothetical protein [Salinirubellus salinus]UWM53304.1 hypothetical protein N0B31_14275 [Salinirubellus salinus]